MKIKLPIKFRCLIEERSRYKVFYGGRGGAKSRSIAAGLIHLSDKTPLTILCTREIQKSIRDSVKRLLDNEIERQGLQDRFSSTNVEIKNLVTGSVFIFAGLWNNVDNIKSIEGVDIVWIEEAHSVSQRSLDVLFPTIRKPDSEIWISYNPFMDDDPVHKMFVLEDPPPKSKVIPVNYIDNPWFPEVLKDEMEWCRITDIDRFNHVWEGHTVKHSAEQVFLGKWKISVIEEPPEGTRLYHGVDWGFSEDPTAAIRCFESPDGKTLYIDKEVGGVQVELDDIPEMLDEIETFRDWPSYGDCSRPETISHVKGKGYHRLKSCAKWTGCVEDGISFIRSYREIIVDPSCKQVIYELINYKYKKDPKTDEILPVIIDKNNHYMDALRYALGEKIKGKGPMKINPAAVR